MQGPLFSIYVQGDISKGGGGRLFGRRRNQGLDDAFAIGTLAVLGCIEGLDGLVERIVCRRTRLVSFETWAPK